MDDKIMEICNEGIKIEPQLELECNFDSQQYGVKEELCDTEVFYFDEKPLEKTFSEVPVKLEDHAIIKQKKFEEQTLDVGTANKWCSEIPKEETYQNVEFVDILFSGNIQTCQQNIDESFYKLKNATQIPNIVLDGSGHLQDCSQDISNKNGNFEKDNNSKLKHATISIYALNQDESCTPPEHMKSTLLTTPDAGALLEKEIKSNISLINVSQNNFSSSKTTKNCNYKSCKPTEKNLLLTCHLNNNSLRNTDEKHYKCEFCGYKTLRKNSLKKHIAIHSGEKPYKCGICEYRCLFKSNLNVHVKTHTAEKPYKCGICDYKSRRKLTLQTHIRGHTGEKPYKCDLCCRTFLVKSCLKRHLITHTSQKPFKCEICEFKCSTTTTLKNHVLIHTTDEKPYKCDVCNYRFLREGDLKQHVKKHTGDKPFKCGFCEFRCSYKGNFNVHIRRHTGREPYKCGICESKYFRKKALELHIRVHTGEETYKCHICDYSTLQKNTLEKHIRRHASGKPCNNTYSTKGSLNKPVVTSTSQKPYTCDKNYEYNCTPQNNFESHSLIHKNGNLFQCDFCGYKSLHAATLKVHVRSHTGEKPYTCGICEFKCSQKSNLKTHVAFHTGEKQYKCEICDSRYLHKSRLDRHIRTHMVKNHTK